MKSQYKGRAWVGRCWDGKEPDPYQKPLRFDSLDDAEEFVARVEQLFPDEVHEGQLYIDAEVE